MRIGKIGHATLVIKSRAVTCLTDPVLVPRFTQGLNRFHPEIELDVTGLVEDVDAVILSHAHPDHFSPSSLFLLDRAVPVFYPSGEALIQMALERLGFENVHPVFQQTFELGDLSYTPTESSVGFPERGMLFQEGKQSCWNLVDTVVGDDALGRVRTLAGRVDVALAGYQPLFQDGKDVIRLQPQFDRDFYASLVRTAALLAPRCVVPSSCGFSYTRADLNTWGFPITEAKFLADVKKLAPRTLGRQLPAGASIDTRDLRIRLRDVPSVRVKPGQAALQEWRPQDGVPPLRDENPFAHSAKLLRQGVTQVLDEELPRRMAEDSSQPWLARMSALGVVWELEVIFPDGETVTRHMEFKGGRARWVKPRAGRFTDLRTAVTASGLVGWMRGELDSFVVGAAMVRVANRLTSMTLEGATACPTATHEPLTVLMLNREARVVKSLEHELEMLGV